MITLIGTGHVFDLRNQILEILNRKQPDIICVELDEKRYVALMQRKNGNVNVKADKNASVLYRLLGKFQESMAKQYGVQAGDEMLTSIQFAHDHQRPIAFIDVAADQMFARMLHEMTFTEKLRLLISSFGSMFVSKQKVDEEINKIETNLESYLEQVGDKFPTIKRVLLDERNQHMANQIIKSHKQYEEIVAIVGDGHIPGLKNILEQQDQLVETIRLKELRKKKPKPEEISSASFSVEYNGW